MKDLERDKTWIGEKIKQSSGQYRILPRQFKQIHKINNNNRRSY